MLPKLHFLYEKMYVWHDMIGNTVSTMQKSSGGMRRRAQM